jgi:hypothetical protein
MSSRERFANLLKDLLVATRAKRLTWTETADENVFAAALRTGAVNVGYRTASSIEVFTASTGRPMEYFATLHSSSDRFIEELTSKDFEQEEHPNLLEALYHEARNSALQPDDVFNAIEAEVRKKMAQGA